MASSNDCDLMQAVITCEGDLHDPEFHLKFGRFLRKLKSVLCPVDKQRKLRVRRVEPWNSVRVTFTLPREAAVRLRQLAQVGDEVLRELGVLSVQLEGDQVISLTIAGRFNEPQEIAFRTDPVGRTAPPQPPECATVGGAVPAKLNNVAPGAPLSTEVAQNKNVMEILTQAVGVLAAASSAPSCAVAASHDTPSSSGDAPKPLATPSLGFLSPNVVAPHHQPVPFVPPTPPPTAHRPLTNTYPFASMVHAAQTAQSACHAPGARLPLAMPSARMRTSSPLTFSGPDAPSLPLPPPPRGVAPPGAPPKPIERNGLSNSLLVNLLQCEQKPQPPGAPKSLAPPGAIPPAPSTVSDASNLTLAASVTVVNVRTGVAIPNLSNLANAGALTDAPPLSAPTSLSAPSSPQFAKIDLKERKSLVHSTVKVKPASPAPSSPSAMALVAAPAPASKSLPFIPGGATVTAVTHLNPVPPAAPPPLQTTNTSTVGAPPMGAPTTNLLDGMVCVNDTYMLPGRNNLSITVVSDRTRLGLLAVTTNSAGTTTSSSSSSRNTPPPAPPVVTTATNATVLHPSLQPVKSVESTSKSTSSPLRSENDLLEVPASATTSLDEDLSLVLGSGLPSESSSTLPAGSLGVLDTEKSTSGAERIKLRLRLEKSEPVVALAAYKVEKTCSGPVSFLRKGTGNVVNAVNAVPSAKMAALPVIAGCNASNSELRVPPLHISLKGRNATLLSPPGRSPGSVGGANSKEDTSEDESGKFASKRKPKSKDISEPRKPFKRKRSVPLIESDPEEEEEPKPSLGEELRGTVVETSTEVPEINAKIPRLSHDPSKHPLSPEKTECETPSLVPPELKKARLAPEVAPPSIPPCHDAPLVANSVLLTPPVVPVEKSIPEEDKVQELLIPSDLELTKSKSGTSSSTTSATLPLITRTVHLNHVKLKEEPLLKVSVLNNVQKQVHQNSLLHRSLELTSLELEKEDKGGGGGGAKEMTQVPPPQALEAAACKDEPVNTQGEDSGIESMDALSEKSPNQGESPSRREERTEPEIIAAAHSHSHAYVDLAHRPNHLPSPPVNASEEVPEPEVVKKVETKILREEEELEEETTPSKEDHTFQEAKTEVMVNGTSGNSGRSSASTSPCPDEKEVVKVATPTEEKIQENSLSSPSEACVTENHELEEVLGVKVTEQVPATVVEAVESTTVPEKEVVTSPPKSPASPGSRKRRKGSSASPEHIPSTFTPAESAGTLTDTPLEEEQKVETRAKTPPLLLEDVESLKEPVKLEAIEDLPESTGKVGEFPAEEVPAGNTEASTTEETSPSPISVPVLPSTTPPEEESPSPSSPIVLSDSPAPPTLPEPVLVPATVPPPVTITPVVILSSSSTVLSDSPTPSSPSSTVVTTASPSVAVTVPSPSLVELAPNDPPPSVESSHSSPRAPSPAPVIPSIASLPPSPSPIPTCVASPCSTEATHALEPAPSLAENSEMVVETVAMKEIGDDKDVKEDEPEMVVERPLSATPDVTERLGTLETTETPPEDVASFVITPVAAIVVKEETSVTEESVETVTASPPSPPKVETCVLVTEDSKNAENSENIEGKGAELVKTEPFEENDVPKSEIVEETLTRVELEMKEELPLPPEVSPPEAPPPVDPQRTPELVSSDVTEVNAVKEPLSEEASVRTKAPPPSEPPLSEEVELICASVTPQTLTPSAESVNVPKVEEKAVTVDTTPEAPPSDERTVKPTPKGVSSVDEPRPGLMENEFPKPEKEEELEEEGEELGGPELIVSLEEGGGVGGSVSASGPNSPFHGFCDKEMVVPPVVEVEGVVVGGDTPLSVEPSESLLLSGTNTPSEESSEATTLASVTKVEGETPEEATLVTEQLRIEIPDVVTRCTRSGTRVISPDANARVDRRSPRQASPVVLPAGVGVEEKLAKRGVRRKRQESESSNASQGRNTPDAEDLSVTSRPSKRKCSENATELIKACMGLEDTPKRVVVGTTTTTNTTTTTADPTPPPPNNSVKRNSKGGLEEDPVTKLTGVNSEEEDNHLSDDEPLSELAHRAVRQALKDRTTRLRGSNVKRGGAKTFKERGAGGRRNSTDSPSGLNNSRSVTPTRRSGRALVGIKVATPTVLGAEATELPTRRKTRSSCVTVPDGDGSQPANRRRPVSKDRR